MDQIEKALEGVFRKAPALPTNIRQVLAKIAPWLNLVGLVIAIPAVLGLLGLGAVVSSTLAATGVWSGGYFVFGIIALVQLILNALAAKPLFAKSIKGWRFLFWASLVSAVGNLVQFALIGLIIGNGLALYCLFQIKEYYHE